MQFARVIPVKVRRYSAELHADVSRVVGYRAECSCGWRSGKRATVRDARNELAAHRWEGCERS